MILPFYILDCSHVRLFCFSLACLMHVLFYLHVCSLTFVLNQFTVLWTYCSGFWYQGLYSYLCLLRSQCQALLKPVLMVYQHPVHQEPFWTVSYKNWALYQLHLVEQLYMAFHYIVVASATANWAEFLLWTKVLLISSQYWGCSFIF